mmetsp:Transcript_49718/g.74117  ORF Transcript_49718/g.74117 Transcript_49718/m.74117 type:complete len:84 (+) Transcript_49718:151-402(+)
MGGNAHTRGNKALERANVENPSPLSLSLALGMIIFCACTQELQVIDSELLLAGISDPRFRNVAATLLQKTTWVQLHEWRIRFG